MIPASIIKETFFQVFGKEAESVIFSHGRLEIVGNHTDHNHGLCLVAGCDLGITCAFHKRNDSLIRFKSDHYPFMELDSLDVAKNENENGTSLGIIRGVCARLKELGYVVGGFDAAALSDIPAGAGVSSSACFESLIVGILNVLFNDGRITPIEMAKVGQYAENVYFGKPSGLLDQVGTSFGGIDYIDFGDMDHIIVEPMEFNLPLDITLVLTPSSHEKLTPLYAEIPADMKEIAALFGKDYLREVPEIAIVERQGALIARLGRRKVLRARHFYKENKVVLMAKEAVLNGDTDGFLAAVKASGESSEKFLFNTMVPGYYEDSPQEATDYAWKHIIHGATRIMGGGFAGSILCFTAKEETASFKKAMEEKYGTHAVIPVHILPKGPIVIDED